MKAVAGIHYVELPESEICCGSAGIYNILQPEIAQDLGQQKARNLVNTGATVIASANVGCTLQIRQHLPSTEAPVVLHPMQLLAASIQGRTLTDLIAES